MDIFNDMAKPLNVIWVDAKATARGDGSTKNPFRSIDDAINVAKPGTAIMVRAGEYHENVSIPRDISGTDDAPIWLISADGPGKAHIIAPNMNKAAIGGGGIENFVVDGFHVTGGKNGIQFSQNGFDFDDMIKNIVVRNNIIDGIVEDGVKMNGGDNVWVHNNKIVGGKDEGIDYVAINHGVISHNEVSGNTGRSAGIFAKGGSNDIRIVSNHVHDVTGDGISVGGYSNYFRDMRPGFDKHIASNVIVEGNIVESVGKRPLAFFGAADSSATNNYLEAAPKYFTAVYVGNSNDTQYGVFTSHDIVVKNNHITRDTKLLFIDEGSDGVTFENNHGKVSVGNAGLVGASDRPDDVVIDTGGPIDPVKDVPLDQFLANDWKEGAAPTRTVRDGQGSDGADFFAKPTKMMAGGAGDDTYLSKDGESVVERAGGGTDTVSAQGRHAALSDHVENLHLHNKSGAIGVGNSGDNVIKGTAASDYLVGNGGRDKLTGGAGADAFIIDAESAVVRITDFTKGDVILIDGNPYATFADLKANLHQMDSHAVLVLSESRAVVLENIKVANLTAADFEFQAAGVATAGKSAEHRVQANSATHLATGTDGADQVYGTGDSVLKGGGGDDNYILKSHGDHIVERAGGGVDTVLLFHSGYVMDSNVENARIRTDAGAEVTGNNLANIITGGAGADVIAGGAGADLLDGGKGADRFVYTDLTEGGDLIKAFELGLDKLDLRALKQGNPDLTITTAMTDEGLAVYADDGDAHVLITTLSNVISTVDPSVLFVI